jgi:hypothetical protein
MTIFGGRVVLRRRDGAARRLQRWDRQVSADIAGPEIRKKLNGPADTGKCAGQRIGSVVCGHTFFRQMPAIQRRRAHPEVVGPCRRAKHQHCCCEHYLAHLTALPCSSFLVRLNSVL